MKTDELKKCVTDALDDLKAVDVLDIDVHEVTSVTDIMIIATGTSDRHAKSLASHVIDSTKTAGIKPLGVEGLDQGDWVLIDLGDVVVHIMRQEVRDFYNLEKLWSMSEVTEEGIRAQ
ncbi:MAG: ribosome silencing factor [Gammaproteobacteria bacterium]|nr:ribosome silencing factor [Gammaproteobacteria bacterium]MDH5593876.1 ribosome silencing factor [Gammaproteobacteria bacterium]MDH5614292.1 ribosome silencing factor [Gammaproteobacteria bacterium]